MDMNPVIVTIILAAIGWVVQFVALWHKLDKGQAELRKDIKAIDAHIERHCSEIDDLEKRTNGISRHLALLEGRAAGAGNG